MLKQGGLPRTGVGSVSTTSTTPTLTQSATTMIPQSHIAVSSAVPINTSSTTSTNYHVPRGAAAVANIAAPRSSVATPIMRASTNLQAAVQNSGSFVSRSLGPALSPRQSHPTTGIPTGALWLSTPSTTTVTHAKPVSPHPSVPSCRASVTVPTFPAARSSSVTVTTRVVTPNNRLQSDSQRPQLVQTSTPKPAGSQLQITEDFFKSGGLAVQNVGTLVTQVLPGRTPPSIAYNNPLSSSSATTHFVATGSASTLIAAQQHQLISQNVSNGQNTARLTVTSQGAVLTTTSSQPSALMTTTTVLSPPSRVVVSSCPCTGTITSIPSRVSVSTTASCTVMNPNTTFSNTGRLTLPSSIAGAVMNQSQPGPRITVTTSGQNSASLPITTLHNNVSSIQPRLTNTQVGQQPTTIIPSHARISVSSTTSTPTCSHNVVTTSRITMAPASNHQNTTVLASAARLAVPSSTLAPASVISLMVTNASGSIPTKAVGQNQIITSACRAISAPQIICPKVITQQNQGSTLQITQLAGSSVPGKMTQGLHNIAPITAPGTPKTVTYNATTGVSVTSCRQSAITTQAIPVTKIFSQSVNTGRTGNLEIESTDVPGPGQPVHPQAVQQQSLPQGTNVFIQTSHRTSPALLMPADTSLLTQSTQMQPVMKPNASPRPSILRKRDNEGSPMKAQKNLKPILEALNNAPVSPPSPRRPDSRGNGNNSSGGSTTISATSSPGLGEVGEDSLPPIKQEPQDDIEKPVIEMSPRKKPRKQQLTGNELHEPKFSDDEMEFFPEEKIKKEIKEENYEEKFYYTKRPNISLLSSYKHSWKSRHNHFIRYSDIRPKDDRRPTISEMANQKQITQKLNGWKIYHLSTQMEDLSELETQVFEKLSSMLKLMERKAGKDLDKDINRVNELIKGNIQRSKVIKDQMQDAKCQVLKIFDHKSHVVEIINRCSNKRTLKKREKS